MNDAPTVLILGGYGTTGRKVANHLLAQTPSRVVVAGRSREKAEAAAADLNAVMPGVRASAVTADASDSGSLRAALQDVHLVVVASSTARYAANVARAALQSGCDYLDVQYSADKVLALQRLSREIERAGRCFVTDGGFHPGVPAALIRYAAGRFDTLHSARVGSVIQIDWDALDLSPATMEEFVDEFLGFEMMSFRDGEWRRGRLLEMMHPVYIDFGAPFGRRYCVPMFLEELRALPSAIPSLRETGFLVGGFNWFSDWIAMPVVMAGVRFAPRRLGPALSRFFYWSLCRFSQPPYGTVLKLEADGVCGAQPSRFELNLSHPDGYEFTAIPVVACLLQLLDGSVRRPGLWTQAGIVEPARFLSDIERMGVTLKSEESGSLPIGGASAIMAV